MTLKQEKFPYLYMCPSCEKPHAAVAFEEHALKSLQNILDLYIKVQQSRQLKPENSEDEESPTYLLGEIKRTEHILEDIIDPAARLFSLSTPKRWDK